MGTLIVQPLHLDYAEARLRLRDGDICLWLAGGFGGKAISDVQRGQQPDCQRRYSHAAMASWCGDVLEHHESLQWIGTRTTTLSSQVDAYPGLCDVWRPKRADEQVDWVDRDGKTIHVRRGFLASQAMRRRTGTPYGVCSCIAAGIHAMFRFAHLTRHQYTVEHGVRLCCSASDADSTRRADMDPAPGHDVREVSPMMLANPEWADYLFTLF